GPSHRVVSSGAGDRRPTDGRETRTGPMDDHYQYLALMAGCLLITLPLEFVFSAKVYRRPKLLLAAMLPVVIVYSVWDIVGIWRGHWSYNPQYVTGIQLPLRMPLEELVFFVVIPICGLLTYESVGTVLTWVRRWRAGA
ncbi:MAG: lycopene cyclase domain-containing protein, partial [Terracoccus sp.]